MMKRSPKNVILLFLISTLVVFLIFHFTSSALPSSTDDAKDSISTTIETVHADEKTSISSIASHQTTTILPPDAGSNQQIKVLTFNPLYPWFGLTNQMLSYASATRFALDEGRSVLFPDHHRTDTKKEKASNVIDFHLLFNATLYFKILRHTISNSPSLQKTPIALRAKKYLRLAWREDATFSREEETKKKSQYFHTPLPFFSLNAQDREETVFVPASAFPFVSMNKKNLYLPNRDVARIDDKRMKNDQNFRTSTELYMKTLHSKSSRFNFTRHHNFFMRYPWFLSATSSSSSSSSPLLQEAHFLNSLQPVDVIENYWFAIAKLLSFTAAKMKSASCIDFITCAIWIRKNVVTIHLRLEPDAYLLSKKLPTSPKYLVEWLKKEIFSKKAAFNNDVYYIALGEWPSKEFEEEMIQEINKVKDELQIEVWWRSRLLMTNDKINIPSLPKSVGSQREIHQKAKNLKNSNKNQQDSSVGVKNTQDHFLSFVDFLFLSRSRKVVMSRYSSLKFAIYSRRCYHPAINNDFEPAEANQLKEDLRILLPFHQRVEWEIEDAEKRDNMFIFDVDEKSGQFSEVSAISCRDRSRNGWAGHKSWS